VKGFVFFRQKHCSWW